MMQNKPQPHRVVIGVCSSVASYKAIELTRCLVKAGCSVRVVLTANASHFIKPLAFLGIGAEYVYDRLFRDEENIGNSPHIFLLKWADALVVYPASANFISKCAHGIADDALSTFAMVFWQKPVFIVPAMHTQMWQNPILQRNLMVLKDLFHIINPIEGMLADGTIGIGHIEEPQKVAQDVLFCLGKKPA